MLSWRHDACTIFFVEGKRTRKKDLERDHNKKAIAQEKEENQERETESKSRTRKRVRYYPTRFARRGIKRWDSVYKYIYICVMEKVINLTYLTYKFVWMLKYFWNIVIVEHLADGKVSAMAQMVKLRIVEWEVPGSNPGRNDWIWMIGFSFFINSTQSFMFKSSRCHAAVCCNQYDQIFEPSHPQARSVPVFWAKKSLPRNFLPSHFSCMSKDALILLEKLSL